MMQVQLRWENGGEALVVETDGARAVLRSNKPAAPGTPLLGHVAFRSATALRFKVQECRREDAQWFQMRGRWMDLSRAAREELLQALKPTPED